MKKLRIVEGGWEGENIGGGWGREGGRWQGAEGSGVRSQSVFSEVRGSGPGKEEEKFGFGSERTKALTRRVEQSSGNELRWCAVVALRSNLRHVHTDSKAGLLAEREKMKDEDEEKFGAGF